MVRAFAILTACAFAFASLAYTISPESFAGLEAYAEWYAILGGTIGVANCAPGAGLAGALANMAKGCPADPGARELVLADRIDASRIALGNQVNVKLGAVPNRDSLGRFAHVRGIHFSAKGAFTVAGATNDAVRRHQLMGLYQSIRLADVTGHTYFEGIDGRDISDDAYFRHWSNQQWPYMHTGVEGGLQGPLDPSIVTDYGIATNVGAATYVIDCSLYLPLASNADGASPLEGLIPLAALQIQGDDALRFTVANAAGIPGNNAAAAPAGIVFAGFRNPDPALQANAGMEIWLDVVYLDHVVVDAPWTLESYVLNESSGQLRHMGRIHEYIWARYHENDTPQGAAVNGFRAIESVTGYTLTVAGFNKLSAFTLDQMVRRMKYYERTIPDSALSEACATRDLPTIVKNAGLNTYTVEALALLPLRQRETAPAGAVVYNYATDPNAFVRYLHRSVMCSTADRVNRIASIAKCAPCGVMGPNGKAPETGYQPVIVAHNKAA